MKKILSENEMIQKSKDLDKRFFLVIISLFILLISIAFLFEFNDIAMKLVYIIAFIIIAIIFFWHSINDKIRSIKIKKSLIKKFGKNGIVVNRNPNSKYLYEDKTRVGNIRDKYAFSIFIKKYGCCFNCYSEQTLTEISYYVGNSPIRKYHYKYEVGNYINEYKYNFEKLGISAADVNLRYIMDKIKCSKMVNIEVSFVGNDLIVQKETMKNDYSKYFADIDVNDVEFFYNFIIEELKEGKSNVHETKNITNDNY